MKTGWVSSITARPFLLLTLLSLLGLFSQGCSGRDRETRGQTYTVRGQVKQLPDPRNPGTGLYLAHEAIDTWVGRGGEVEGMDAMTMPFPVGEDVPLEGLQPGDFVEIDLHVDWEADLPVEITSLRELPPGTRLVFDSANPDQTKN